MSTADEVQKDPPTNKPATVDLSRAAIVISGVVLLGMTVSAGLMIRKLVNSEQVQVVKVTPTAIPTKTRIVSSKDLEAYTLLTKDHLTVIQGRNETVDPNLLSALLDRYLLIKVTEGTEIKSEMLAPSEAKVLIGNSVEVSIPATATLSLGNQLRVGDMIDLLAIPANRTALAKPEPFEKLLVLTIPVKKPDDKNADIGAITLALPTDKRDDFASATAGATLVITRRIPTR